MVAQKRTFYGLLQLPPSLLRLRRAKRTHRTGGREGRDRKSRAKRHPTNERTNAPPRSSIPLSRTIWKREARRSEVAFLPPPPFSPAIRTTAPSSRSPSPSLLLCCVCTFMCTLSRPPRSALSETPTQSLCKKRRPLVAAALDVKKRGLFPPPLSFDPPPSLPFNGASAVCYSQEGETRRGSGRGEEVEEEGWLASRMPPPPIPSLYPSFFFHQDEDGGSLSHPPPPPPPPPPTAPLGWKPAGGRIL